MTRDVAPGSPSAGFTVVLKATDRCNGACTFCSVGGGGIHAMSEVDFELVATRLEEFARARALQHLCLTFHGGEPLLLGPEWLDRACRRAQSLAPEVELCMQSNLLDITDDMMSVLLRHRIAIGSSIDPLFGERRCADGTDAFSRWLEGFERLTSAGFSIGTIFVITRRALDRARELYRLCESLAAVSGEPFGLQTNPVYAQGRACDGGALITAEELGGFFLELWKIWEESGRTVRLSPIESFAAHFPGSNLAGRAVSCSFHGDCSSTHVGVNFDLRVAGCGRRLDGHAFFGDLRDSTLESILATSEEKRIIRNRRQSLHADPCVGCRYFKVCQGGCPDDAALSLGDVSRRSPWCSAYQRLLSAMEERYASAPPVVTWRPAGAMAARRIFIGNDSRQRPPLVEDGAAHEHWLFPVVDGSTFSYDRGLDEILATPAQTIRLYVSTKHTKSLFMWADVIREQRVSVGLLDAHCGLAEAMNTLNALGATVRLDLPAMCRAGVQWWPDLDRFLSDPLWKSQVWPWSAILANCIHGRSAPLLDALGLPPGTSVELAPGLSPSHPELGGILATLLTRLPATRAHAWQSRRTCVDCEYFRCCGGCLASGDGSPCPKDCLAAVARLCEVGRDLERVTAGRDAMPARVFDDSPGD